MLDFSWVIIVMMVALGETGSIKMMLSDTVSTLQLKHVFFLQATVHGGQGPTRRYATPH